MTIIKPIIIDNILSQQYKEEIARLFLSEGSIPWYLTYETTQEGGVIETTSVMYHLLQYYKHAAAPGELFHRLKPAMWDIIEASGLPFKEFLQVRAIMQFPVNVKRTHNLIHTDLSELSTPYYTAVYYINDGTDGDTVLFNETAAEIAQHEVKDKYKGFTIREQVTPKQGKTTIFPGNWYHSSTLPTIKTRAVLNFSWR